MPPIIGSHTPMSRARTGTGRCVNTSNLKASIRILITLFNKANSGANGNAIPKSVIKPN